MISVCSNTHILQIAWHQIVGGSTMYHLYYEGPPLLITEASAQSFLRRVLGFSGNSPVIAGRVRVCPSDMLLAKTFTMSMLQLSTILVTLMIPTWSRLVWIARVHMALVMCHWALHIIHKSHTGKFLHWEVASIHWVYLGSGGHTILLRPWRGLGRLSTKGLWPVILRKAWRMNFTMKSWLPSCEDFQEDVLHTSSRSKWSLGPCKNKKKNHNILVVIVHDTHQCISAHLHPAQGTFFQVHWSCFNQLAQAKPTRGHSKSAWSKLQQFLRHRKV